MSDQEVDLAWSPEKITRFQTAFLTWYDQEKRILPWRENTNPYRVWISEIMLQQTQVNTVIPYFLNFMTLFPTLHALAQAPEATLLKAWEGLGYYSRARNLQAAAQQVEIDFGGLMPQRAELLTKLKGIGPYTAGAVASISFNEPVPAVDGNVMRVMSRLFEIKADIAQPKNRPIFENITQKLISETRPGDFNQALMDLGSQICTPKVAHCERCPLKEYCQSFATETMLAYPVKTKKAKSPVYSYAAIILKNKKGAYLLTQRPSNGLLGNLWTVPLFNLTQLAQEQAEQEPERTSEFDALATLKQELLESGLTAELFQTNLPLVTHIFTHQKWQIKIVVGELQADEQLKFFAGKYVETTELAQFAMPTVQKKIWSVLKENPDFEIVSALF